MITSSKIICDIEPILFGYSYSLCGLFVFKCEKFKEWNVDEDIIIRFINYSYIILIQSMFELTFEF